MKKVDEKKTLAYAVAFVFCTSDPINFMMGKTMYQHVKTVYNKRSSDSGHDAVELVYNYKAMKYEALNVNDIKVGGKEILILNN